LQEPEKYHGTHLHHFMALDGEATMACIACIDILLIALHKTEAVVVTQDPDNWYFEEMRRQTCKAQM